MSRLIFSPDFGIERVVLGCLYTVFEIAELGSRIYRVAFGCQEDIIWFEIFVDQLSFSVKLDGRIRLTPVHNLFPALLL
jgi:hypothetical protein